MADGAGSTAPPSRLAQFLTASRSCDTPEALAEAWCDSTVTLRLARAGRIAPKIGPHLRRSFLGALGPAASIEAQNGEPCPWDPPCALDLFCREQMRDTRGNGLPKPYVLWAEADGPDLMVSLRLFGIAGDWALGASEALITGLRDILPWDRLGTHLPAITERHIEAARITSSPPPLQLRLYLLSPMDISGRNPTAEPWSILTPMIRRVDAVSRWGGATLAPEISRALSQDCRNLRFGLDGLQAGWHHSANRRRQKRNDPVIAGRIDLAGDLGPLWPLLCVAERCHMGRHAVEGLGRIGLDRGDPDQSGSEIY